MSLTASMWTGVSGLLSHGEKMNVIGNNIANVNTVGFKGQRMDFEDFIYQNSFSSAGATQIGRGVGIGAVMGNFGQGSYETTTEVTDLAIQGRGFFKVSPQGSKTEYFSRAGNFRFNKAGYLNDPNGYTLQGWKIDTTQAPTRATGGTAPSSNDTSVKGSGVPTDVRLDTWTVQPLQTTKVSLNMTLSANGKDQSRYTGHPFTSMLENWNGKQPPNKNQPYLSSDQFSGSPATIEVFDEAGGSHTLTVYFDQVNSEDYGDGNKNQKMWEYVVTMDPAEDMRKIAVPQYDASGAPKLNPDGTPVYTITDIKDTKQAGVLMSGTLRFDGQGNMVDQSAYVVNGNKKPNFVYDENGKKKITAGNGYALDPDGNPVPVMDPEKAASYMYPTEVSSNGYPMMVANFTALPGADSVGSVPDADKYLIELDFGCRASNLEKPWLNPGKSLADSNGDPSSLPGTFMPYTLPDPSPFPAGFDYTKVFTKRSPNQEFTDETAAVVPPAVVAHTVPEYLYENPDYTDVAYIAALAVSPELAASKAKYMGVIGTVAGTAPNQTVTWAAPAATAAKISTTGVPANENKFNDLEPIRSPVTGETTYHYQNTGYDEAEYFRIARDTTMLAADKDARLLSLAKYYGATPNYLKADGTPATVVGGVPGADATAITWTQTVNVKPALAGNLAQYTQPSIRDTNSFHSNATVKDNALIGGSQNGYGYGDLTNYTVSGDGILSGIYSNGVTLPLYQITLYDFTCKQGLRREGGNLFSQTMESGDPSSAAAGSVGFGTISAQTLEGSNVDLSTEFVQMIATQRGFQSNSKMVTTVDTMLETVINMKR